MLKFYELLRAIFFILFPGLELGTLVQQLLMLNCWHFEMLQHHLQLPPRPGEAYTRYSNSERSEWTIFCCSELHVVTQMQCT